RYFGAHFGLFLCQYDRAEGKGDGAPKDPSGRLGPLTTCLALRPNDPMLYYLRGMTHFEMKQFDLAYQDFDAAVGQDPQFRFGYYYRGRMALAKKGSGPRDWEAAEKDFTAALKLDEDFDALYAARAIVRAKRDR